MRRVALGRIHADAVGFTEAVEVIVDMAYSGDGGYVVTPNVDHVVLAETRPELREAYAHASLSLVDGMPLLWMARLLRSPLPEKISGSDLIRPLVTRAAKEGLSVYFLGGKPGVGERAAQLLRYDNPELIIAGIDAPPLGFETDATERARVIDKINAARPNLVFVALGCPKQELFMCAEASSIPPAVMLGIGAGLDFIAGTARRSPRWMSRAGLEWLHRLAHDPRRLAHRYLVRDRAIAGIFLRALRS